MSCQKQKAGTPVNQGMQLWRQNLGKTYSAGCEKNGGKKQKGKEPKSFTDGLFFRSVRIDFLEHRHPNH
jgi:hypothetical protein